MDRYLGLDEKVRTEVVKLEDVRAKLTSAAGPPGAPPPRGPTPGVPVVRRPPPAFDPAVLGAVTRYPITEHRPERAGASYRLGAEFEAVQAFDLRYVRADAPVDEIGAAYALYVKVRSPAGSALTAGPALDTASNKPVPYPLVRAASPHFEYWANALYAEVNNSTVCDLALRILQHEPKGPARRLPRDAGEAALATANPAAWLDAQDAFDVIDLLRRHALLEMTPVPAAGRSALLELLGPNADLPHDLALAYHCTGRAPEAVTRQGSVRVVEIPNRLREIGALAHAWHPFSTAMGYRATEAEPHRGQAYFRRRSADNELNTTVSIAQDAVAALDFPLVEGVLVGSPAFRAAGGAMLPDGSYTDDNGQPAFEVRAGKYVTHAWLYVVCVDAIYDTAALQRDAGADRFVSASTESVDGAPQGELATLAIPPARHIAAVRYERVHFGSDRQAGMRYRIVSFVNLAPGVVDAPGPAAHGVPPLLTVKRKVYTERIPTLPVCGIKRGNLTDTEYATERSGARAAYPDAPPDDVLADLQRQVDALTDSIEAKRRRPPDPDLVAPVKELEAMRLEVSMVHDVVERLLKDRWRASRARL